MEESFQKWKLICQLSLSFMLHFIFTPLKYNVEFLWNSPSYVLCTKNTWLWTTCTSTHLPCGIFPWWPDIFWLLQMVCQGQSFHLTRRLAWWRPPLYSLNVSWSFHSVQCYRHWVFCLWHSRKPQRFRLWGSFSLCSTGQHKHVQWH